MFCSKCGQNADSSDSFCSKCGNKLTDSKPTENEKQKELSSRVLCNDGNCIGVIGENGLCKECQKPYDQNFSEAENSDDCFNITERERITAEREKQKKSSRNLWLFFITAILILGYFGKNYNQKPENIRDQSQCSSSISSPVTSPPTSTNNNDSHDEQWVKIVKFGDRVIFYDANNVKVISDQEKEVFIAAVSSDSSIINQERLNKTKKQRAIGYSIGRKYGKIVQEFDFSKFGWIYSDIEPKSAESILMKKLWEPKQKLK